MDPARETSVPASHSPSELCVLCGGMKSVTRYNLGSHQILRCPACSYMWLSPRPTMKELQETVYIDTYFQNVEFLSGQNATLYGYVDYMAERFTKQERYRAVIQKARLMLSDFRQRHSRMLDVGSGYGYLMDVADDEGFQVSGVEFSMFAAQETRRKYAFPVFAGDILAYDAEPFDMITMFDVIEHMLDPLRVTRKLNSLLKPQGLLVLTTMDCDSLMSRLLGTRLEDFRRTKEHVCFFTRSSITRLLEIHGFEVLRITFYGHTFRLDFLAERLKLVSAPLGNLCSFGIRALMLNHATLNLNPCTKMLVLARKTRNVDV